MVLDQKKPRLSILILLFFNILTTDLENPPNINKLVGAWGRYFHGFRRPSRDGLGGAPLGRF